MAKIIIMRILSIGEDTDREDDLDRNHDDHDHEDNDADQQDDQDEVVIHIIRYLPIIKKGTKKNTNGAWQHIRYIL